MTTPRCPHCGLRHSDRPAPMLHDVCPSEARFAVLLAGMMLALLVAVAMYEVVTR